MSRNLWLEFVIDAYLQACADGRDWKAAVAEAEHAGDIPLRVLTREDLKEKKGIPYSRQSSRKKFASARFRGHSKRPFKTRAPPRRLKLPVRRIPKTTKQAAIRGAARLRGAGPLPGLTSLHGQVIGGRVGV